jgi:predicted phosphoribosyltransferase
MRAVADDVFAVRTPSPFIAIGGWYHEFTQTSDDEVAQLLAR